MTRSPFQGTWQPGIRPTVVTAPDALVYINGATDMMSCGQCRRRFDINKYITSLQVDLSVESAPGSASINMSIPGHAIDSFYMDGEPIITDMMEVEIYAKGFFNVENVPQYYPIFWGLVTEVTKGYSGGANTFSISCADILKWWELCKMNVNPGYKQAAGQFGKDYIYGNLFNANVYDIIWTLAQQSFGDVVQATGSLGQVKRDKVTNQKSFREAHGDIIGYWNQRFSQMRSNLMLYGVEGAAVRGDLLYDNIKARNASPKAKWASKAVRNANGGRDNSQLLFDPEAVVPFRSALSNAGSPALFQSEYQTKLEIANACKEAVGFEFYMDVTGDIVFKPPFYNLDVMSNKPISWIQPIDIIDSSFSESEAEVVTHLQMQGSSEGGAMDMGVTSDYNTPYAQAIDYHLLRKYGVRSQTYNAEFMRDAFAMFHTGLDMMDRMNARRFRGSVTIPMRPELRLGFPIYVADEDQVWYITGISHSLTFGGRAQTQLTLTAKRSKFIAPQGIGSLELNSVPADPARKVKEGETPPKPATSLNKPNSPSLSQLRKGGYTLKIGEAAEIPRSTFRNGPDDPYAPLIMRHPKTNRIVGYPNVVMSYTRPYQPTKDEARKAQGVNTTGLRKAKKIRSRDDKGVARDANQKLIDDGTTQTEERQLADKHLNNRYVYGLTSAGVYTYVHDKSDVIDQFLLVPAKNIEVSSENNDAALKEGVTAIFRPVSDERGFEVIGHNRYGRGVALRDGSLVLSNGGPNQRASVDTQVALSGGLFETLTAQSQGLSILDTASANPVDALVRLQPEDLQTAGYVNPDTNLPEFIPTGNEQDGTTFVDVAPLGSSANEGVATNVEAAQLSNAQTLAEMRPLDGSFTNECSCLLGRPELAFINVGYNVKTVTSATEDNTNLATEAGGTGSFGAGLFESERAQNNETIQAAQAALAEAEDALDTLLADPLFDPDSPTDQARQDEAAAAVQAAIEILSNANQLDAAGPIFDDSGTALRPVSGRTTRKSPQETVATIETFLSNLYTALDGPHQQYEAAIRGKLLPAGPTREQIITGDVPQSQVGDFAPPFNTNRALGGDPRALAIQGKTANDDMSRAWRKFGDGLKSKPNRAYLEGEIARQSEAIRNLNLEEERLQNIVDSGSTTLAAKGSAEERLKNLSENRSKLTRQRDNNTGKLNTLNNKFPE